MGGCQVECRPIHNDKYYGETENKKKNENQSEPYFRSSQSKYRKSDIIVNHIPLWPLLPFAIDTKIHIHFAVIKRWRCFFSIPVAVRFHSLQCFCVTVCLLIKGFMCFQVHGSTFCSVVFDPLVSPIICVYVFAFHVKISVPLCFALRLPLISTGYHIHLPFGSSLLLFVWPFFFFKWIDTQFCFIANTHT